MTKSNDGAPKITYPRDSGFGKDVKALQKGVDKSAAVEAESNKRKNTPGGK